MIWGSTIISSVILSLVISIIIINLIDQIIPCSKTDNKYSAHGILILEAIVLILVVLYVFYAVWKDVDPCYNLNKINEC